MTLVSLFSGIGGMDLAFERAGFEVLAQCEIDENCQELLRAKWPYAGLHDDVKTFDADGYSCPSVVAFGSPCQDLSCAGQRKGINGERSSMFFYAIRIIQRFVGRGLQFALWENVPGVFSSNGGRDFAAVLSAMANIGALDVGWVTLDAQWFGLRKRCFLVADFRGRRCAEILSLSEGLCGHPAPSREAQQRVAPTVEGRAGTSGVMIPCANRIGGQANAECVSDGSPPLTCNHEAPICIRTNQTSANGHGVSRDLSHALDGAGAEAVAIGFDQWQGGNTNHGYTENGAPPVRPHPRNALAFTERTRADGRNFEAQDELAYALTNPGIGGRTHSRSIASRMQVRRLTPLECLRLMGFSDDHLDGFGFSDSVKYRLIGNSVAIPVVEWIARRISIQLQNKNKPTQ